jgi:hypothetical protein
MTNFSGKMILNDTKKSNYDFLREYLTSKKTKRLGIAFFLDKADYANLPGNPEIVLIKEIYTNKLFWLLEEA